MARETPPDQYTTMTLDELIEKVSDAYNFDKLPDMLPLMEELNRRLRCGEIPSDIGRTLEMAGRTRESFERRMSRVC